MKKPKLRPNHQEIIAMSLEDLNFILKSEYVLTNRQTKQIKSEIKRKRNTTGQKVIV
ncbi:MAG: hypothetical protein WBG30_07805 [Psychrilyobacter sp.]|uniref:hypothetical protein n=1 Tax=Psychrilyobacter sp. TaxID=2586924 RepID=UPI003C74C3D3